MADGASFDNHLVSDEEAIEYWNLVDQVRRSILEGLPRFRRWKARLSLRHIL